MFHISPRVVSQSVFSFLWRKRRGGQNKKKGEILVQNSKRKEKSRTTTECKGTREPFLLAPPGVWNAMVCVISSPSIETPLIFLLFFVIIIIIIIIIIIVSSLA